jgi:hypothetical protein
MGHIKENMQDQIITIGVFWIAIYRRAVYETITNLKDGLP